MIDANLGIRFPGLVFVFDIRRKSDRKMVARDDRPTDAAPKELLHIILPMRPLFHDRREPFCADGHAHFGRMFWFETDGIGGIKLALGLFKFALAAKGHEAVGDLFDCHFW